MQYSKEDIISKIERALQLNANNLKFHECYYMCANKEKLDELLNDENQIIFGRRGTGKTTILKALTYYINEIYNEKSYICWYSRLDEIIPNNVEIKNSNIDTGEIITIAIKKYLSGLLKLIYNKYGELERNVEKQKVKKYDNLRLEKIIELIFKLDESISDGTKQVAVIKESSYSEIDTFKESGYAFGAELSPTRNFWQKLGLSLVKKKTNKNSIRQKKDKSYIYRLDINEIRTLLEDIASELEITKFYICIDEFAQIDRDFSYSIQPQVAQIIKQLFFNSNIFVVKISSVWNESRMQKRQMNGNREGIELGHDIFTNAGLDFDTMFSYDDTHANFFFSELLLNLYELYSNEKHQGKERDTLRDYIIQQIFTANSFPHLICGSQGIPRVFCMLLVDCIRDMKARKRPYISTRNVFDKVTQDYLQNVRRRIPYSISVCKAVEKFITDKKIRFFLVNMNEYENASNYFDGLVANNALHQCPSEQLPRMLRNTYKLYFVHYGNYLDALGEEGIKELYSTKKRKMETLYPPLPNDIYTNTEEYLFKLPESFNEEIYCSTCRTTHSRPNVKSEGPCIICLKCSNTISMWC